MNQILDEELSLAPGFLVALAGDNLMKFPHLRASAYRRARRGTVPLVAELSRSDRRPLGAVVDDVVERTGAPRAMLVEFASELREIECLSPEPPRARHAGVTVATIAGAPGPSREQSWTIPTPASMLVEEGSFLWFDHDGVLRARLSADELLAAAAFGAPATLREAWEQHSPARTALTAFDFDALVVRLLNGGLLRATTARDMKHLLEPETPSVTVTHRGLIHNAVAAAVDAHDREMDARPGRRTPVVPINVQHSVAPTSLGLLVAHAQEADGGRLRNRYEFVPSFLTDEQALPERAERPSIFLFSNYVWNVEQNLALSALVKRVNPANITVHGGPSTPKYTSDAEEFFAEHGHVDVTVRGEGEVTFAELLDALDPDAFDRSGSLDALGDVAGLSFRSPGGPVCTADRDRITDLDSIPSPYLLGLLDPFGAAQAGAIVETNRGCPYGCTFCDWGSATLSRIRKFSLDRVFAELEWCAVHQIDVASIADANFGIMERDVEIAQKIADLKREYGYPKTVAVNYAKNTVKHLRQIIEIFAEVEILTEGLVSLQSMDEPTLKIIRRSNIKLDKYNELSTEFRRARLPLAADIMMGLPGSTPAAFRNDLQQCTNRDVRVRANRTQLLPNSPMNDPEYRREHGITAKPGEYVREARSFTRDEWDEMDRLRVAYNIFDNWGVLRYVARFVRQEAGMLEVDLYDRLQRDVIANATEWPTIVAALNVLVSFMAPPPSWGLFIDEVHRYVTGQLGVADDSALRVALQVQLAHLPAPERAFPHVLSLEHDFVSWQDRVLEARESGHRDDWEVIVPRLSSYPPAELEVSDPNEICRTDVGKPMGNLGFALRSWELHSAVARPRLGAVAAAV